MYSFFSTLLIVLTLSPFATAQQSPVQVVPRNQIQQNSILKKNVIDLQGQWAILSSPSFKSFGSSLYLVMIPGFTKPNSLTTLNRFGKVWAYIDGELAIISIKNDRARDQLASLLHNFSPLCGNMRALYPEPLPQTYVPTANRLVNHSRTLVSQEDTIKSLLSQIEIPRIQQTIKELESWKSRFHSDSQGRLAGEKLAQLYAARIPSDRADTSVELFSHSRTPQKSVIVRIIGQKFPNEVLVLGSHLDSINPSTDSTFAPGADDNASGTATNLEVFRVLMANKIRPARTIEIHAYAAEEIGLVGSAEIARTYRKKGVNVLGAIQFDMTAFSAQKTNVINLLSTDTDPKLTQTLGKIVEKYLGMKWVIKPLTWGTSDHKSWTLQGYSAAFPFEDPDLMNRDIHTSNDVFAKLNAFDQAANFSRIALAYLLDFGGF